MAPEYRALASDGVRRVLSQLDRRPWSPTYGCGDRAFWHYKTLLEFPRATFQQPVWALALAYRGAWGEPEFAGRPGLLDAASGALSFWAGIQHRDGTFAEWHRNERSFCATAFTAAAAGQAARLLGEELPAGVRGRVDEALARSVRWLSENADLALGAGNQLAAALLAAHAAGGRQTYLSLKARVLALQDPEGWLSERGGADIGYGLLSLDLLTRLWAESGDPEIERASDRLLDFLSWFVHSEGLPAGYISHRSTAHCFPYGLERLAAAGKPAAREAARTVRSLVARRLVATPASADDAYSAYFYLNSFALAAATAADLGASEPEAPRRRVFSRAGLVVDRAPSRLAVVNARKGTWQVLGPEGRSEGDAGYVLEADSARFSSQLDTQDCRVEISQTVDGLTIRLRKRLGVLDVSVPLPTLGLAFRAFTQFGLFSDRVAAWFSRWLKATRVLAVREAPVRLERVWDMADGHLEVRDRLTLLALVRIDRVLLARQAAAAHSPSAQAYAPPQLAAPSDESAPKDEEALET